MSIQMVYTVSCSTALIVELLQALRRHKSTWVLSFYELAGK